MINVLFASGSPGYDDYEAPLRAAFEAAGLAVNLSPEMDPAEVEYVIYGPSKGQLDFTPFKRLKAVLSLWAGVETMVTNETLQVPLCRMVDHGLTEGMVEWVMGHALRFHLGMDTHLQGQDGIWRAGSAPPLARERKVCVLGLGALGSACAQALAALNFEVHGWVRLEKSLEGVTCHHGESGLAPALRAADIVVLLLPATPATTHVINAERLALLAPGACLLNPGRGPLVDDDALLAALAGGLGHAVLDVFDVEPLPADHPFWAHPKVVVTPHIASETRAVTAAQVVAENVRRGEAGEPFLHQVDRDAGY
ncbi:glyoxylate/hydroxypyruvate reductase A [Litoreibacter ponti]|uniref:Glyoxylate/hydroxypyruvate reductase A n=1 Tax=Litoreibacter ponti TaxID=1510457 RepID=A0A2T6BN25_9RHOB|nr:glyoxylate/hydroxypyruvate reductase A [Litoreibacter ponti]PTX57434.1 glyoxylate/hydroxypyruvate reductase A [Litoreibacter ponti]